METFAAAQVRDYTEAERAAVDGAMARIENLCAERGYALDEGRSDEGCLVFVRG